MDNQDLFDDVSEDEEHFLHLSPNKITFEGVSKSGLNNVFFDESNIQVFSVLSGDVTEVDVKSPYKLFCKNFKMDEKGRVISIKFSPDQNILALQRTHMTIEFMSFANGSVFKQFSETFKGCTLLGYIWSGNTELVVITSTSVKLFKVDMASATVSLLKSININVCWFTYYQPSKFLLVKLSQSGYPAHLLQIKQNQIMKLAKFDLYSDSSCKRASPLMTDRDDAILGVIYNKPRILFMNYQTVNSSVQTEVVVRTIINNNNNITVKVTNVLRIHETGRFALNIVDNLIVVHNQVTKSSLIFDILDSDFVGVVIYHVPVVDSKSIKPYLDERLTSSTSVPKFFELYSPNWVIFQPNIVMDVKVGCLWSLELNLAAFHSKIKNRRELIQFLLLRKSAKNFVAKTIYEIASDPSRLEELANAFSQINSIYRNYLELQMKSQLSLSASSNKQEEEAPVEFRTVFDQSFMNIIFCKLIENEGKVDKRKAKILSWVILEYIRSLTDYQIPAQHFIYDLLIKSLVTNNNFFQLHQLLQYHVIADSKPLACLLLSLENLYPPASQLAIDMLERLGTAKEQITEILLSKQQVLSSLRYTLSHSEPHDRIFPEKYLEAARATMNPRLYYTIMRHFKSKPKFSNGNCVLSKTNRSNN